MSTLTFTRPLNEPLPQTHRDGVERSIHCPTCGDDVSYWTYSDAQGTFRHEGYKHHVFHFGSRGGPIPKARKA